MENQSIVLQESKPAVIDLSGFETEGEREPSADSEPQLMLPTKRPWYIIRQEHKAFFSMASAIASSTSNYKRAKQIQNKLIVPEQGSTALFTAKQIGMLLQLGHELNISKEIIFPFLGLSHYFPVDVGAEMEISEHSSQEISEDFPDLSYLAIVLRDQLPGPINDE